MRTNPRLAPRKQRSCLFVATQFYPPDYAPTGQLISELVTFFEGRGSKVKIFTGQPGYAFQEEAAPRYQAINESVFIRRTQTTRMWSRRVRGKLITGLIFFFRTGLYLIKNVRSKDTLLLPTTPPFLPILGAILHTLFKVPYVCLIYDLYPDVVVELGVIPRKHWIAKLWNWTNRFTWSKAQQIIVLSDSMKARVTSQYPAAEHKIKVIHNWSDPDWIKPIPKENNWFAQEHGLTDKFTVLYSGNMGRCHDVDTILETAILLKEESVQFVFIGGGAGFEACKKQAEVMQLKNCLFLPYVSRKDLPYSLAAADLSLVSMKANMEGVIAPSKLYSVMASGRPVAAICPAESYLRQLIHDARCGDTFINGDSPGLANFILQLAENIQVAGALGTSGREYLCRHFTVDIIAEQYAQALNLQRKSNSVRAITSARSAEADLNGSYTQGFRAERRLIGQILYDADLLSAQQVSEILKVQVNQYPHLRFGELAVLKGWVQQDAIDTLLKTAA
jgi:glycosyltransferase involved in cell wall biosynthesis